MLAWTVLQQKAEDCSKFQAAVPAKAKQRLVKLHNNVRSADKNQEVFPKPHSWDAVSITKLFGIQLSRVTCNAALQVLLRVSPYTYDQTVVITQLVTPLIERVNVVVLRRCARTVESVAFSTATAGLSAAAIASHAGDHIGQTPAKVGADVMVDKRIGA